MIGEETERKIILFAVKMAIFYQVWTAYEIVKNMLKTKKTFEKDLAVFL